MPIHSIKNITFAISAILVAALGAIVIVGWYTHTVALIQVNPAFVPMQFNTALCFLCVGIALLMVLLKRDFIARILSALIGLIGVLTLAEYCFNLHLGIDELFMVHDITVLTTHPGRMAPNTALCFLLSAIGIAFGKDYRGVNISGVIGFLIFGLGVVSLIGYRLENASNWGYVTRMAVHTAFGFLMIGSSLTGLSLVRSKLGNDGKRKGKTSIWLLGYIIVLSLLILLTDLSLPLGVATGMAYMIVILFALFTPKGFNVFWIAIFTTVLTIVGFIFSPAQSLLWIVVANRLLSIGGIWVVASLVHVIKKKQGELRQNISNLDGEVLKSTEELKARNKELEQFVYIASHDLQEPLRTITSFTTMLVENQSDELNEVAQKSIGFIEAATLRMSVLVNGLLNHSRIGQKKERELIDCGALVQEIIKDLESTIEEKKATITVGNLPSVLGIDIELRMLFENIIENGLRYAKPDVPPVVDIRAERKNGWTFAIEDNGIGIEEQYFERILVIFKRLHTQREHRGAGIGLAHCKKIVDLLGGKFWIESTLGHGSTFFFNIPDHTKQLQTS